jgi:hypothetical protein
MKGTRAVGTKKLQGRRRAMKKTEKKINNPDNVRIT